MHSESGEPLAIRQSWGLAGPSPKGPRARLTLLEITRAAVEQADEHGFESVTLAAVATRLGLATTALYRYVDSKDTLIELMIDEALGPAPAPLPDVGPGVPAIQHWADALWDRYAAHPWLATFPLRRAPRCPHAFEWLDALVGLLNDLPDETPMATALAIDVLVRGFASLERAAAVSTLSPELSAALHARFPRVAPEALPAPRELLAASLGRMIRSSAD